MLAFVKEKRIIGIISEIILHETIRHAEKIGKEKDKVKNEIERIFPYIYSPPRKKPVEKYNNMVIDHGDSHVLASSIDKKCQFLVTLDQKRLLILKNKIKKITIVSPKELIIFCNKF